MFEEWEWQLLMILHGSIVKCMGIDVNSLSSAWLEKSTPLLRPHVGLITNQSLARDISQTSDKPNCNKKFKYKYIFEFWCICIIYIHKYIFAHTSCTLAYNTSRHCTHTSHRWVARSKENRFHSLWDEKKKVVILSFYFLKLIMKIAILAVFVFQSTYGIIFIFKNVAQFSYN